MTQKASLTNLEDYPFDVIVIGAGINGAGIARDAAMRGLKVLLLDKGDMASGTTGYSSRLIHGGLRYLEYGDIGLVWESLSERERLFHNAPHLVKQIPLTIPLYENGQRKPQTIRLGMIAYDLLSLNKSIDHHHMLNREQIRQRLPEINQQGLEGAALYYDGQAEYPERLCVENVLSAQAQGAVVLTYTKATRLLTTSNNIISGVECTNQETGKKIIAHGRVVVNAAGPWVDEVMAEQTRPIKPLLSGTKGTHYVVDKFLGAPGDTAVYYESRQDHRPILVLPWNGKYLLGTTDIRYHGDLDNVTGDEAEMEYILNETNNIFPNARLTRDSVLFSYSGVRPLPHQEQGAPASITRQHIIYNHAPSIRGLLSVIGGKLTTHRRLAEEVVNIVFRKIGQKPTPCATANIPLPGADTNFNRFQIWFHKHYGDLPEITRDHLLRVYGTRAIEVLNLAENDPKLSEQFCPETGAIGAEVIFACQNEMAHNLTDIMLRRTMAGLGSTVGIGADEAASKIAWQYLNWDALRVKKEIDDYRKYIERYQPKGFTYSTSVAGAGEQKEHGTSPASSISSTGTASKEHGTSPASSISSTGTASTKSTDSSNVPPTPTTSIDSSKVPPTPTTSIDSSNVPPASSSSSENESSSSTISTGGEQKSNPYSVEHTPRPGQASQTENIKQKNLNSKKQNR